MIAQLHESDGRVLLGDNTGGGPVVLHPIRLRSLEFGLQLDCLVSSSTVAQQPTLGQGLPQKLLPSVPTSCGTPPMSFPQLLGITRLSIFPS